MSSGSLSFAPARLQAGLQYAGRVLVLVVHVPQITQRRGCFFMFATSEVIPYVLT
jgi:hypothetical protein